MWRDLGIAVIAALPFALPLFLLLRRQYRAAKELGHVLEQYSQAGDPHAPAVDPSIELAALREYFDATHTSDPERVALAREGVHAARDPKPNG